MCKKMLLQCYILLFMGWGETNINITFENDIYKILPQSMVHPCKLLLERRADNQTTI